MKPFILLCFLLLPMALVSQDILLKQAVAVRTSRVPKIDGKILEQEWNTAQPLVDFRQYVPVFGVPGSFPTEVRILYDDDAVYVAARMYDPHPDSILRQLGNRDDEHLNADYIAVEFDTYNNQLDAYQFLVHASGVQNDSREFDDTYDAVWESEVNIDDKGWTAEMRIPYSMIRFPVKDEQLWRIEVIRSVRRYKEIDQWALEVKGVPNDLVYWGELRGIEKVNPSIRLSWTPYLSASMRNYPYNIPGQSNNSYSFGGGVDMKYGLDQSYTLDLTLLPDFSQVQSDNQIKNLSAFETIFEEQRPFFKEAVDLFEKGDLFYSRRIGRIPQLYGEVENMMKEGEKLKRNPPSAKLLNAFKLSGRNKNGLALGLLNAVTDNTYALAEDSMGNQRKILTDPSSNYNIVVVDQALKNNSSVYLINTNTIRGKSFRDANVTGSGISLYNKSNTLLLKASGASSRLFYTEEGMKDSVRPVDGSMYNLFFGKVKGNYQGYVYTNVMDNHFSANDMGVTQYNNYTSSGVQLNYLQFEPKGILRDLSVALNAELEKNYATHKITSQDVALNAYGTLMNYLTLMCNTYVEVAESYDYYEPRVEGRYYRKPRFFGVEWGFSSDYRKPFALDGWFSYYRSDAPENGDYYSARLEPLVRINDHFFFTYSSRYSQTLSERGFSTKQTDEEIFFGSRDVREIENSFSGRYMFRNNLSLNLYFRHYWAVGDYKEYYLLEEEGTLSAPVLDAPNGDFNFSAWNVDLVFWWEFAPGSRLNLIWKNAILREKEEVSHHFTRNLSRTWESPQENSLIIKVLYYLDYQYFKKDISKH